jgi:enoyl-CoA hydratase/carnithine racemase
MFKLVLSKRYCGNIDMDDQPVLLERQGLIATLTLNRAKKLNAIQPLMLDLLETYVRQLDRDEETRVVLLTGAGERAFCVGADINEWAALEPLGMWRRWIRDGHRVFDAFARLRQPTIAVLNGYTLGGGLELALAADLRIAAEGVMLAAPEVKIGTVPGWAGTQRLPALIGSARAKEMIFTGRQIDARTAERWGLVNEVVSREELWARAIALAEEIAGNAPVAVQIAKQAIDGGLGAGAGMTLEALAGAVAAATEDGREGVASFREKRPAHYKGR